MVSITEGYIKESKKQVSIIERKSGELYTQKPYAKDKEERKMPMHQMEQKVPSKGEFI